MKVFLNWFSFLMGLVFTIFSIGSFCTEHWWLLLLFLTGLSLMFAINQATLDENQ